MKKQCVCYLLDEFPVISETFILNEILAAENQTKKIVIFSLNTQ